MCIHIIELFKMYICFKHINWKTPRLVEEESPFLHTILFPALAQITFPWLPLCTSPFPTFSPQPHFLLFPHQYHFFVFFSWQPQLSLTFPALFTCTTYLTIAISSPIFSFPFFPLLKSVPFLLSHLPTFYCFTFSSLSLLLLSLFPVLSPFLVFLSVFPTQSHDMEAGCQAAPTHGHQAHYVALLLSWYNSQLISGFVSKIWERRIWFLQFFVVNFRSFCKPGTSPRFI